LDPFSFSSSWLPCSPAATTDPVSPDPRIFDPSLSASTLAAGRAFDSHLSYCYNCLVSLSSRGLLAGFGFGLLVALAANFLDPALTIPILCVVLFLILITFPALYFWHYKRSQALWADFRSALDAFPSSPPPTSGGYPSGSPSNSPPSAPLTSPAAAATAITQ
jgi:hypothetical protein